MTEFRFSFQIYRFYLRSLSGNDVGVIQYGIIMPNMSKIRHLEGMIPEYVKVVCRI